MAIRRTAKMGHPILRQRAEEVPVDQIGSTKIQSLIDDLVDTLCEYQGVGLAAPQAHEPLRIFTAHVEEEHGESQPPVSKILVVINPIVSVLSQEKVVTWEGCLSIPGLRGPVERFTRVKVDGFDREGKAISIEPTGFGNIVIQHENDHLDGILFIDRMKDLRELSFLEEFQRYHLRQEE